MAGIDVPSCDNAVGLGANDLVGLHRQQLLIGGPASKHRGMRLIGRLLRNNLLGNEYLIACVGYFLQPEVGLCIRNLLVELGRLQDREHFTFLHTIALVDVDRLQISGSFRVDRRLDVPMDAGGKRDALAVDWLQHLHYQHAGTQSVGPLKCHLLTADLHTVRPNQANAYGEGERDACAPSDNAENAA
jgi:hypothetical protein